MNITDLPVVATHVRNGVTVTERVGGGSVPHRVLHVESTYVAWIDGEAYAEDPFEIAMTRLLWRLGR